MHVAYRPIPGPHDWVERRSCGAEVTFVTVGPITAKGEGGCLAAGLLGNWWYGL